jgi:hypothetical protein
VRAKYIELVPWKWEGLVVLGGTVDDYRAHVKRELHVDLDPGAHAAGHSYVEYGKPFAMWVERADNLPAIAHEAFHVTSGVLEGRGLKHTAESEEAYTYTMERLIAHCVNRSGWRAVRRRR